MGRSGRNRAVIDGNIRCAGHSAYTFAGEILQHIVDGAHFPDIAGRYADIKHFLCHADDIHNVKGIKPKILNQISIVGHAFLPVTSKIIACIFSSIFYFLFFVFPGGRIFALKWNQPRFSWRLIFCIAVLLNSFSRIVIICIC